MRAPFSCHILLIAGVIAGFGLAGLGLAGFGARAQEVGYAELPLAQLAQFAEQGDADAQFLTGKRYHDGNGVLQNFTDAAAWFDRAAQQGHPMAQNALARYHFEGLGVAADPQKALLYFEAAAKSGDAQFLFDFASALEISGGDPVQVAELYRMAAAQGHLDAQVSLGVLYQHGTGVTQDLAQAYRLYEGPANAGHARALNNLGLLYVRGDGVAQDYARAAELFTTASELGLKQAHTNLGVMYENAFGVPLDEARAEALYRKGGRGEPAQTALAAGPMYDTRLTPVDDSEDGMKALVQAVNAGDPVAQFQLGWLILNKADPQSDDLQNAARLLRQASENGLAPAMANLGWMYFEGFGVPQDYALGHMWLALAVSAGFDAAAALNAELSQRMPPEQINQAQKMAAARQK